MWILPAGAAIAQGRLAGPQGPVASSGTPSVSDVSFTRQPIEAS